MASGSQHQEQSKSSTAAGASATAVGERSASLGSGVSSWAMRFVLAVHLVADLALLVISWQFTEPAVFFVLAWPMGQNALIALWAARADLPSYCRFAVLLLGACATWFLSVGLLPDVSVYDRASAAWALGFTAQSALIVLGVAAYGIVRHGTRGGQDTNGRIAPRLQFTIGSLLVWTAVIALTLGLGKSALSELRWTGNVSGWTWFYHLPLIGTYNAVYALIIILSLTERNRRAVRILLAGGLVAALGWSQPYLLRLIFTTSAEPTLRQTLILAGAQAVYLYASLLPLRIHSAGRRQTAFDGGHISG